MTDQAERYVIRACNDPRGTLWYAYVEGEAHPAHWGGHMREEWAREWVAERGGIVVAMTTSAKFRRCVCGHAGYWHRLMPGDDSTPSGRCEDETLRSETGAACGCTQYRDADAVTT